jgi:DNA-binding transcriptional LysR family regulator
MGRLKSNRIKPSQLRALVAVADCGNFTEASLQLELSQSAISHAIASLEEELGVTLLLRGRQGAQLTPMGEGILANARQVLHLLDSMVEEANLHKGLQVGLVKVAAFTSVARHLLPAAIARFQSSHPQVMVTALEFYDVWDVEKAVREGYADLGITELPCSDEFEGREIQRDSYIGLLPPFPENPEAAATWEQLIHYPIISYVPGNTCYIRLHRYLQSLGLALRVAHEVRDSATITSMVHEGLGAAILSKLSAEPIPPGVRICALPTPLERSIGTITLKDKLLPPAVFAFLDCLTLPRLVSQL